MIGTARLSSKQVESSSTVVVLEPVAMVRAGIAAIIEQESGLRVLPVATEEEGVAAIAERSGAGPVVVLVSVEAGGQGGAREVIRRIRNAFPTHRILAMGNGAVSMAVFLSIAAGADGYLDRCATPRRFVGAVEFGLRGGIQPDLDDYAPRGQHLTTRETEVLATVAEGLTAGQIAARLGIAERTVGTHLGRIYSKLGVNGRIAALSVASRHGVLTGPTATLGSPTD